MEANRLVVVIFGLLLVVLLLSIFGYGYNRPLYLKHRIIIRKVYYWLVLLISLILFASGNFPFDSVTQLTAFAIAIVIIDLFVFQTPDITSFMSSELKQEELEKDVVRKSQTVENLTNKLFTVNDSMNLLYDGWQLNDFNYSFENYTKNLEKYLETFCVEFGMNLYMYKIEINENEDEFRNNIKVTYNKMIKELNFSVRDIGMTEEKAVRTLEKGVNIEVIEKSGMHVLLPYYSHLNLLVVVSTRPKIQVETSASESKVTPKGIIINGADASILLMLMNAFDLWLLSNPQITEESN